MPSISGSIFNLIIAIMRKVKVSWFLAVPTIYLLSCISAPISYDTAEIPNYHERIKVGLGGQISYGNNLITTASLLFDSQMYPTYQRDYKLRVDFQWGYGMKRLIEIGVNGGIAFGPRYEYYYDNNWNMIFIRNEIQVDAIQYIKIGTPTDPFRFSIKPALGTVLSKDLSPRSPYLILSSLIIYLDLLFGFGKPEFLTSGVRLSLSETPIMFLVSLHFQEFTPSLMLGYYSDKYDQAKRVYFGISRRF